MISHRMLATAVTAVAALLATSAAHAGDQYSFPSASGALFAANAAQGAFVPVPQADGVVYGFGAAAKGMNQLPLTLPPPGSSFYAVPYGGGGDAYGYRFVTSALTYAPYANYRADYYRLFTPSYAVTAWTDRVSGLVDIGYGGAVDSWTATAYYMNHLRGPAHRREGSPDLSVMPKFGPHPELENTPTFSKP